MFDLSKIEYVPFEVLGLNGSMPGSRKALSPKYYSHFISNGYEYIFVPIYKDIKPIEPSSDFNQVIYGDESNEPLCFYFRATDELNSVVVDKSLFLVFMTLFYKETNEELDVFYDYLDLVLQIYCLGVGHNE